MSGEPGVALVAGRLPGLQRAGRKLRLVVEHLLEVGHEPLVVHRVAVEPSADMVVDPPPGHRAQGAPDHPGRLSPGLAPGALERRATQQEGEARRPGELGRATEAPVAGIEARGEVLVGLLEGGARRLGEGRGGAGPGRRPLRRAGPERVHDALGLADEPGPVLPPSPRDGPEDRREPGAPPAVPGREVRSRVEGLEFGRQPDAERPAPLPGERLDVRHVHPVHVRPLLPVELDAHEVLVQEPRDRLVLERLVGHHVAPVAGRVSYREEDGAVGRARGLEGLIAPREPVHGIARVLQEVRRRRIREPVRHLYSPSTQANTSGATIVASDSMMNFGVAAPSLPQVIFSFGTAPE